MYIFIFLNKGRKKIKLNAVGIIFRSLIINFWKQCINTTHRPIILNLVFYLGFYGLHSSNLVKFVKYL